MIHYVNFPRIPDNIMSEMSSDPAAYSRELIYRNYAWSKTMTDQLLEWCRENVCDSATWGVQVITGDLGIHKDYGTCAKFLYLFDTGGENVHTHYHDDNGEIILSYRLEAHRWHIFRGDALHSVTGIESGRTRFSISGRLY